MGNIVILTFVVHGGDIDTCSGRKYKKVEQDIDSRKNIKFATRKSSWLDEKSSMTRRTCQVCFLVYRCAHSNERKKKQGKRRIKGVVVAQPKRSRISMARVGAGDWHWSRLVSPRGSRSITSVLARHMLWYRYRWNPRLLTVCVPSST